MGPVNPLPETENCITAGLTEAVPAQDEITPLTTPMVTDCAPATTGKSRMSTMNNRKKAFIRLVLNHYAEKDPNATAHYYAG
jgi:hypothetical protein